MTSDAFEDIEKLLCIDLAAAFATRGLCADVLRYVLAEHPLIK